MTTATAYRDGAEVGRFDVVGSGDLESAHVHADKEYAITLEADKSDILPGDVLYAGGLAGWRVLSTRVNRSRGTLLCQVATAPRPGAAE